MDREVRLAKGYNLFIMLLLAVQFAILLGIIIALAYLGAGSVLSIITVVSAVSLMVLCLPLSVLQFLSGRDRMQKTLFRGLALVFLLSSASVIVWYLAVRLPGIPWLPGLSKFLTLLSYLPVFISLLSVSSPRNLKTEPYNKAAIVFLSIVAALIVAFFVFANVGKAGVDVFSTFVYTGSLIFDIVVLALTSMLILTHLQGKLRYLLSIIFITYMASTVADVLMLIDSFRPGDAFVPASLAYALMINFTGLALLAYSFGSIKIVTVEEVNKKLDDARLLTSDLVTQTPIAICVCDGNGIAVAANDNFLGILGKARHEVIGQLDVFRGLPGLGEDFRSAVLRAKGGETVTVEGIRVERNASPSYFRLKMFTTYASDGSINNLVMLMDDVTERKVFEDQLVSAKKQTELYVDLMGHDINNMNQIAMGFLELAEAKIQEDGQLREADLYLVTKPIEALANNSRLIYSIRRLQQEKDGAYKHEPVDVGPMLASVASRYSSIPGKDVRISLQAGDRCIVLANELLGDVFGNLLGNAIKHSEGFVRIDVTMAKTIAEGRAYCKVTVDDSGPGINDEMKGKLFDRLSLDSSRSKGSGFGLCLAKILVEGFGGRLEVRDRVQGDYKKGARFVVTLPVIDEPPA